MVLRRKFPKMIRVSKKVRPTLEHMVCCAWFSVMSVCVLCLSSSNTRTHTPNRWWRVKSLSLHTEYNFRDKFEQRLPGFFPSFLIVVIVVVKNIVVCWWAITPKEEFKSHQFDMHALHTIYVMAYEMNQFLHAKCTHKLVQTANGAHSKAKFAVMSFRRFMVDEFHCKIISWSEMVLNCLFFDTNDSLSQQQEHCTEK